MWRMDARLPLSVSKLPLEEGRRCVQRIASGQVKEEGLLVTPFLLAFPYPFFLFPPPTLRRAVARPRSHDEVERCAIRVRSLSLASASANWNVCVCLFVSVCVFLIGFATWFFAFPSSPPPSL